MKTKIYLVLLFLSLFFNNLCNAQRISQWIDLGKKCQTVFFPKSKIIFLVKSIGRIIYDDQIFYTAQLLANEKFSILSKRSECPNQYNYHFFVFGTDYMTEFLKKEDALCVYFRLQEIFKNHENTADLKN